MIEKAKKYLLSLITLCILAPYTAKGQDSDSIDVIQYKLSLDIGHKTDKKIEGHAVVVARLMRTVPTIHLGLLNAIVDSVVVDGERDSTIVYENGLLAIGTRAAISGDTITIVVHYRTSGYVESYDWGGFHTDNNMYYNLGVAFEEYPHSFGRAWFPCRDNFTDKATYKLDITAKTGWTAQCGGICDSTIINEDSSQTSYWTVSNPIPAYLVSVAVAPFRLIQKAYEGIYGTYPATLGFITQDSAQVQRAFKRMETTVPMYERCFGPYRWGRIGYISTSRGSMEHVNNIALASQAMANTSEEAQSTIAHEFAHAWFGNLVTCATEGDMWINEGGATFCEEIAIQAAYTTNNPNYHKTYYEKKLENVLRTCHIEDNGYRAIYGVPQELTYGSTVYQKGALVWHTVRGYLGDSLFYATMHQFFDHNAFGTIDSWQLRDTLSHLSGKDLTQLFDFYVFRPGFVDYIIDSMKTEGNNATIHVKQKMTGSDTFCERCWTPVTFFSSTLDTATRIVTFEGEQTTATFPLPFEACYAIANYDKQIATACTGGDLDIRSGGNYNLPLAHFSCTATPTDGSNVSHLYVAHHWNDAEGAMGPGIIRLGHRYWQIAGIIDSGTQIEGRFGFTIGKNKNVTYINLDKGFYDNNATYDSLRLVYREDCRHPWRVISNDRDGSKREGNFIATDLRIGDYAIAVVDTAITGIPPHPTVTRATTKIFPNPSHGQITITNDCGAETLVIDVNDYSGKSIIRQKKIHNGQSLILLPGIYAITVRDSEGKSLGTEKVTIQQ